MSGHKTDKAYFAGGCFWGVEYWLGSLDGVLRVRSGYMGGSTGNPTYEEICTGSTGHAETVEVSFDPSIIPFREVAKRFFEIHDPTEIGRQGPDIGPQYRSVIFYADGEQKRVTEELIGLLRGNGYAVVTEVVPATTFYPAARYHQNYYGKSGGVPYCHTPVPRFDGR